MVSIIFICLLVLIIAILLYLFFYEDYQYKKRLNKLELQKLEILKFNEECIRNKYYSGLSNLELDKLYKIHSDAHIIELFKPIILNNMKCASFGVKIKDSKGNHFYITESHIFLEVKRDK